MTEKQGGESGSGDADKQPSDDEQKPQPFPTEVEKRGRPPREVEIKRG
jgi:hypothetical protein